MLLLDYAIHLLRALKIKVSAKIQKSQHTGSSNKRIGGLLKSLIYLLAICSYTAFIFKAEDIHRFFIRKWVGSRVYQVMMPNRGGGTGFAIKAPSGKTYILTNDHICAPARNTGLYLKDGIFSHPTRIVARSHKTDLCLLSAPPGEVGLDLSTSSPELGDPVVAVGHPALDLLTVSNKGEIISVISTRLSGSARRTTVREMDVEDCDTANPKFHIIESNGDKYCVIDLPAAYSTSVLIKQGNSGSPLVDFYGDVVGVVSGMDGYAWGIAVTLEDVKEFLADK